MGGWNQLVEHVYNYVVSFCFRYLVWCWEGLTFFFQIARSDSWQWWNFNEHVCFIAWLTMQVTSHTGIVMKSMGKDRIMNWSGKYYPVLQLPNTFKDWHVKDWSNSAVLINNMMQTTYSITEGLENDFQIWGSKTCEGGCFWCCFCCTDGQSALRRTQTGGFFSSLSAISNPGSLTRRPTSFHRWAWRKIGVSLEVSLGSKASQVMRFPCHKGA